jgi:hypothetical protein
MKFMRNKRALLMVAIPICAIVLWYCFFSHPTPPPLVYSLHGRLVDGKGRPLKNIKLELDEDGTGRYGGYAKTQPDGTFQLGLSELKPLYIPVGLFRVRIMQSEHAKAYGIENEYFEYRSTPLRLDAKPGMPKNLGDWVVRSRRP